MKTLDRVEEYKQQAIEDLTKYQNWSLWLEKNGTEREWLKNLVLIEALKQIIEY